MINTRDFLKTHQYWFLFGLIFLFFISTHILGLHSPYHQDEYKWVLYSHPEIIAAGAVPHPPLSEFIYTKLGPIVGDLNFRFIPFFFGILNFFLIFYLSKCLFDSKKTALSTVFLFSISFYSILATLMVDVDGAIMPMFFLIMSIAYFKLKGTNFQFSIHHFQSWIWWIILLMGAIGGFMIKVSAILPIAAVFFDFLIDKNIFLDWRKVLKYFLYACGGATLLALILVLAHFVFPFFNLSYALKYWEHFWNSSSFLNRGWFQTFIQFFKSVLYTSPLLILPAFFAGREIFKKTRVFYIFILLGLFFYLFAFDFSIGALDRYFQFMIVPLCLISGVVFNSFFHTPCGKVKKAYILGLILVLVLIFVVQFISHIVPSLHPKSGWITRVFSLKWNFLYPFTGGSGPLGFYVSFLFITLVWLTTLFAVILRTWKSNLQVLCLFFIFSVGLAYNLVFIEEYLFGFINGSAPKVLAGAVEFIKNDKNIKSVTVYNDNGGYDVQVIGKYHKRLYTDPAFDMNIKMATLNQYKEFYLEVNMPRIDPSSFYRRYLDSCKIVYDDTDKNISAIVYDCRNAPDVKL